MTDHVYTAYPEIYDAIQSEWDYDRDVAFVLEAVEESGVDGTELLEIGCGTGEHTRRLVDDGFTVTAVDKHEGMLDRARKKTDATVRQIALPDVPDGGPYDVIVALRGVVNHLAPGELATSLRAIRDVLNDDGLLVFDNSALPPDGNDPALDVGITPHGSYGRIVQMSPRRDDRLDWQSILFLPDEDEFFVNSRLMTPFADATIHDALTELGLSVETHDGFDAADPRTVFVASP